MPLRSDFRTQNVQGLDYPSERQALASSPADPKTEAYTSAYPCAHHDFLAKYNECNGCQPWGGYSSTALLRLAGADL